MRATSTTMATYQNHEMRADGVTSAANAHYRSGAGAGAGNASPHDGEAPPAKPANITRRIEKMRMLVDELRQRDMTFPEICALLQYSPSGTRKFTLELRDAGVASIARHINPTPFSTGTPVYRLTSDETLLQSFLDRLTVARRSDLAQNYDAARIVVDGHHLHVVQDNGYHAIKVHRAPAKRDNLVAALFGPAKSTQVQEEDPTSAQQQSLLS